MLGHALLKTDMWQMVCTYVNGGFNVNVVGSKRILNDEKSSILWHKRLGHILKERIIILMKQNMLPRRNFNDFHNCIDCFKGKFTNTRKLSDTRSQK